MIQHASLEIAMLKRDSKRVLIILKELTLGTDAKTWIKGIKCDQFTMNASQTHYDGPSEEDR